MVETKDLYWLAGLIEGEGSFGSTLRTNRHAHSIRVYVGSTDRDVLTKAREIVNIGYVYGPFDRGKNKPAYQWVISANQDAVALMMTLYPLMGERRQEKIKEVLEIWKSTSIKKRKIS